MYFNFLDLRFTVQKISISHMEFSLVLYLEQLIDFCDG